VWKGAARHGKARQGGILAIQLQELTARLSLEPRAEARSPGAKMLSNRSIKTKSMGESPLIAADRPHFHLQYGRENCVYCWVSLQFG